MHDIKHKVIGNLRPFSAAGNYGMVIIFPLTADVCVLFPRLGYHYKFCLEIQGSCSSIYTCSIRLLWAKEGHVFFLSVVPSSWWSRGNGWNCRKQGFNDKHCAVAHDSHQLHKNTCLALGHTPGKPLQALTSPTQSRTWLWMLNTYLSSPAAACNQHITLP